MRRKGERGNNEREEMGAGGRMRASRVRGNEFMEGVRVEDRMSVIQPGGPPRCIVLRFASTSRRISI